jgi:hypothetical protein
MTKKEAIAYFRFGSAIAEICGVTRQAVCGWKRIPLKHQLTLEVHTNGKLKADRNGD